MLKDCSPQDFEQLSYDAPAPRAPATGGYWVVGGWGIQPSRLKQLFSHPKDAVGIGGGCAARRTPRASSWQRQRQQSRSVHAENC
jgi:hypothetical protein